MERNVLSFRAAMVKGYQPRLYSYDPARIPLGDMEAVLNFKTWSKRILAINAYFTKEDSGDQFVVTVYCHSTTGRYALPGSTVDFGRCPLGCLYRVQVIMKGVAGKGRAVLAKAEQMGE
jgi:hypothetical protein